MNQIKKPASPPRSASIKSKRNLKIPGKLKITAGAIAALIIVLAAFSSYAFTYSKIFPNVFIGETRISGLTQDEVVSLVEQKSAEAFGSAEFTLRLQEDHEQQITAQALGVKYDAQAAADAAYSRGRDGSWMPRLGQVLASLFGRRTIEPSVDWDEESVRMLIQELASYNKAPVDAFHEIKEDQLLLYPAEDGAVLDEAELFDTLYKKFANADYAPLSVTQKPAAAKALDIDAVYSQVRTDKKDAVLETTEQGAHKITPHVVGVDFDVEAARAALSAAGDAVVKIQLALSQPKITTRMLEATLFQDTLIEVTTTFSPKKVERTSNVRLAASFVNGTILNPGEEFSYNKVVGPRTAKRGFLEAQIFAAGEIVDGLGGGICQVSSTLYMAALRADFEITSRRNHSFSVDYAPKGEDATVVYGSIDFKFKNTSEYPIKIVATSQNNYIKVVFKGTKTTTKTVKFEKKTLSTKPFTERTIVDNSLAPGARVIDQKGQEGVAMEVYRLVYDANGKLLRRVFENKSVYVPLVQIVRVGPSQPAVSTNDTGGTKDTSSDNTAETGKPDEPKPEDPAQEQPKPEETKPVEENTPPADQDPGDTQQDGAPPEDSDPTAENPPSDQPADTTNGEDTDTTTV